jgi:2-iminobutanoate/2-iminopropanoate deaminase
MSNKYINSAVSAPKALGPYSQAVEAHNGMVFLSGQVGLNPETSVLVAGGVEPEAHQVLRNLQAVLQHLQLSFANVVKTTIFLADLKDFQTVNTIYAEAMGEFRPARSTFQVAALPLGAQIEIEMIAVRS